MNYHVTIFKLLRISRVKYAWELKCKFRFKTLLSSKIVKKIKNFNPPEKNIINIKQYQ